MSGVHGYDGVHDGVHVLPVTEWRLLIALATEPKGTARLASELGYSVRTKNVRNSIMKLLGSGLVELTVPDKPRSKYQKICITEAGRAMAGLLAKGGEVCAACDSGCCH